MFLGAPLKQTLSKSYMVYLQYSVICLRFIFEMLFHLFVNLSNYKIPKLSPNILINYKLLSYDPGYSKWIKNFTYF